MKKMAVSLGRILFILLLLAGLSVCTMSDQSESTPPEDAVSFDQLLANLDELQGTATQNPSVPGRSVFSLPDGSLMSSADLSAYINAIKRDLAAYIYSCTGGKPYLVTARTLKWDADPSEEVYLPESGLMWVPVTWWGRWISSPMISYQHGTQVYRECAPSKFNANPFAILASPDLTGALQNYVECIVGALMATAGYTVVMPDYTGFGVSQAIHPYVNLSLGDCVVGAVKRAREVLGGRGVDINKPLYLTGYSEGGYATMAGARALQGASIPVSGIVPCDGPYSLAQEDVGFRPGVMLGQMLSGSTVKVPSYLLYTASGYDEATKYDIPDPIDLAALLTNESPTFWATKAGMLFDGTHTNAEVGVAVPAAAIPRYMLTEDALDDLEGTDGLFGSVHQLLVANNAWQLWFPMCPLAFVHCPNDDVVPYRNAEAAQAAFGYVFPIFTVTEITFIESVMGTKHVAAYPPAMLLAFKLIRGTY